ncbi:hypothetical protein [Phyllobacterium sophorae]|uniref:hypothetical protein n=1 Tax=Phyllobacterium sophorae TaxID=1520277 RepID=UPI001FDEA84F|nr:hypothetical protein [Phyllobacterium sophorae]
MVCSKLGVTVSAGSCAAAGIAVAMAMAVNAPPMKDLMFMMVFSFVSVFLSHYKYPLNGPIKSTKNAQKSCTMVE